MSRNYVAIHVWPATREALRTATAEMTGLARRQVVLSEALTAALIVALRHPEELAAELSGG
jgi:hypothetical protein